MSESPPREQHRPVSFDTSREREFYKYVCITCSPALGPQCSCQSPPSTVHELTEWGAFTTRYLPPSRLDGGPSHLHTDTRSTDFTARSPSDPVLTAFAQLGALRLNARRVLISLFGRHEQHILTESTRTLSLQNDAEHTDHDELWVGSCTMSYDRSFCKALLRSPSLSQPPTDQAWIVPDLTQDTEFRDHPDVISYPNIRFLAATPIISPKGLVIGAYTVLDDNPRPSLDPTIQKFLSDMAITVMDYLEAVRGRSQHLRAERMIVGIGSFLEGKGSLRNSWLGATGKLDDPNADKEEDGNRAEGTINQRQQEKQVSDSVAKAIGESGPVRKRLPIRSQEERTHRRKSSATQNRRRLPMKSLPETTMPTGPGWTESSEPKKGHQAQLEDAFSRGANIIRESIEVEATIFFDANFSSRGAFVANEKSDYESSGRDSHSSTSGDEGPIMAPANKKSSEYSTAQADNSGQDTVKPCRILGFATSQASSVNDELTGDRRIAISEPFLAGLLRRYPQGKIFNYSRNGSISPSETSDSYFKNFADRSGERHKSESEARRPTRRYKRTRKAILRQDAETLQQLAPNSRSIIFSPLWDSHKGRWYSASIAWTRSPHRVFTSDDELSFLFAFGNSIMAEVHRLGAIFSEQAKSSLLSGLSHELRSPLHGIFGMADLLHSSAMNTLQRGFVHTISSCAFTLLGSINSLLEHASIKDIRTNSTSSQYLGGTGGAKLLKEGEDVQGREDPENSPIQLAAVVEDAVETVFAGYSFFSGSHFPIDAVHDSSLFGAGRFDPPGAVQVVLDIASSLDYKFATQSGAWHAILTNIIGNALKFTQNGFVHVSLEVSPMTTPANGEVVTSKVVLSVRDSGCGISAEFSRTGLFTAFSQEDSMTTGNGLGLSITRRIVLSLGGTIEIDSQKGAGTEVRISADLALASSSDRSVQDATTDSSFPSARDLVRQKSIGLLGRWSSDSRMILRSSLEHLFKECFQMDVHLISPSEFTKCDFYIMSLESLDNGNINIDSLLPSAVGELSSPVVVICPSPRIANAMFVESRKQSNNGTVVEFISQPCGPRKLAKTFEICSVRQRQRSDSIGTNGQTSGKLSNTSPSMHPGEAVTDLCDDAPVPGSGDDTSVEPTERKDSERSPDQPEPQTTPHPQSPVSPISNKDATAPGSDASTDPSQLQRDTLPTVLLVDDNDINIRVIVEFMKKLGCNYATASNGLEALDFFKEHASSIAAIFMDISMPVMDGLESARQIRGFEQRSETTKPVKIIALTGVAQNDLQRDTVGAGMDSFITKPARMKNLVPLLADTGALPGDKPIGQEKTD